MKKRKKKREVEELLVLCDFRSKGALFIEEGDEWNGVGENNFAHFLEDISSNVQFANVHVPTFWKMHLPQESPQNRGC